jgi:hypothetical protein
MSLWQISIGEKKFSLEADRQTDVFVLKNFVNNDLKPIYGLQLDLEKKSENL